MDNIVQIVYTIYSFTDLDMKLNYIMDKNNNIVCWTNKKNAYTFLEDNDFLAKFKIKQMTIDEVKKELERKNLLSSKLKIGMRLLDTVDFE